MSRARARRLAREHAQRVAEQAVMDVEAQEWAERLGVRLPTADEQRAMPRRTVDDARQWAREVGVYVEGVYDPSDDAA